MIRVLNIFVIIIGFSSCGYDKSEELIAPVSVCDSIVSYERDINPLVRTYCITGTGPGTGCRIVAHGGVEARAALIREEIITKRMPIIPNNFGIIEMTQEEIDMFVCWIDNGAPNN